MKDFKKLKVWEKAHKFTLEVYAITQTFPKEEFYGLISQIRRASVSIGLNIAEGCGRESDLDFKRFLQIAFGSACETEYCIILSRDLNYISSENAAVLTDEIVQIKMMLAALINKLK